MFRLRLVLINVDAEPFDSRDRRHNEIPDDFEIPEDENLVRWMDSPVIPHPGMHMWLGCDSVVNRIAEVIQVPDEKLYWEVHFHISTELEMIIAYGNPLGRNTGYPGFVLEPGLLETEEADN